MYFNICRTNDECEFLHVHMYVHIMVLYGPGQEVFKRYYVSVYDE